MAGSRLCSALLVLGGGLAELVVIELGAAEVGLLAGRGRVVVCELLADEVEHERGVDDPDPGGEILPAVVDVGVAAVAGAVAHLAGDAELQRPGLGAGGERVERRVERVRACSRGCSAICWPSAPR